MIFGVPMFAVIYTLISESVERRLKKRRQKALAAAEEAAASQEAEGSNSFHST